MFLGSCVSHAFASVHFCLVVTCWERADLLVLVSDVYFIFDTFQCGILGQVWYLFVLIPVLCHFSSFGTYLIWRLKQACAKHSLAITFTIHTHKVGMQMKARANI